MTPRRLAIEKDHDLPVTSTCKIPELGIVIYFSGQDLGCGAIEP